MIEGIIFGKEGAVTSTEDRRFAVARQKVSEWLMSDGYAVSQGTLQGVAWSLDAKMNDQVVIVGQRTDRADHLTVFAPIGLAEVHAQQIDAPEEQRREAFLWALRFELLRMALDFQGVLHPFRRVTLARRVHWPATKAEILETVGAVRRGITAVVWSINRELGIAAAPMEDPGMQPN